MDNCINFEHPHKALGAEIVRRLKADADGVPISRKDWRGMMEYIHYKFSDAVLAAADGNPDAADELARIATALGIDEQPAAEQPSIGVTVAAELAKGQE